MQDERPAIILSKSQSRFRWTHGFISNVACAIVAVVRDHRSANRIYNIGEEETPTLAQRVRDIGSVVGWKGEVKTVVENELPEHLQSGFSYTYHLETNTSSIREGLNYHDEIPYNRALRETVKWEAENPPEGLAHQFNYQAEDDVLEKVARFRLRSQKHSYFAVLRDLCG